MTARAPSLFCLAIGAGDAATGLLLVAAPALVLRLLGLGAPPGADLVFVRFVGVFVASVGLSYLYPWLAGRAGRAPRLRTAIEITAGVRLAVALFLAIAVLAGALDLPWSAVGAYDALVASLQLGLLLRGFFGDAA